MDDIQNAVLTPDCVYFLNHLHHQFESQRQSLLKKRIDIQHKLDAGHFDVLTPKHKAPEDYVAGPIPDEVLDRRVEITGPVDRKMIVNALNSGAKVFMADFEDSNAPTWQNCLEGQINLCDAINKTIDFEDKITHKSYKLNDKTAVLMVRPRGWHLDEAHFTVDNHVISASLFDFGVFLFHNAKTLLDKGSRPYFYLPKLESAEEAALWHDVIQASISYLSLPEDSVKVTVLIETITAVFQMDEIIYALKPYIIGLNCGRWDYIFSYIKKFHKHRQFVLPDRQQVSMTTPFLKAYVNLLIHTCHKRKIHAMGGMAAQIPIKHDEIANLEAFERVKADKLREVKAGHDGTWVAHPGLIPVAMKVFDDYMKGANQIDYIPHVEHAGLNNLLHAPAGEVTADGVKSNMVVALHYLRSWLAGNGCVPVFNLMEDAATAEICRAQLWQCRHWQLTLSDGRVCTSERLHRWLDDAEASIVQSLTSEEEKKHVSCARQLLDRMIFKDEFVDFLTLLAYPILINQGENK